MTNPTSHPPIQPIALDFAPAARIGARVAYYHSPQQGRYGLDVPAISDLDVKDD